MSEPTQKAEAELNATPTTAQFEALQKNIASMIANCVDKRKRNKRLCITAQSAIILFSFGTTVLIGWKTDAVTKVDLTNVALLLSTMATGLAAFEKFFDYKQVWVINNMTIAALRLLEAKLKTLQAEQPEYLTIRKFDKLFEEFVWICQNHNNSYSAIRNGAD